LALQQNSRQNLKRNTLWSTFSALWIRVGNFG
jgi:glutaredoxin-related protein